MKRKTWIVFWIVQLLGEAGSWWDYTKTPSEIAGILWLGSNLLLLPGRIVALVMVERILWTSGLTLAQLTALGVAIEMVTNLAAWMGCAKLIRLIKNRRSRILPSANTGSLQ